MLLCRGFLQTRFPLASGRRSVKITPIDKLIIGNGAGPIKDLAGVEKACKSGVSTRVTVGAGTVPPVQGNTPAKAEGTFYIHPIELWAMNSLGLPNPGEDEWRKRLPKMVEIAHGSGKSLGFNASGFAPSEYGKLVRLSAECNVDYVQVNLSCSNVWGPAGNKAIAAENPDLVVDILEKVERAIPFQSAIEVEVKVAPNDNPKLVDHLCDVIAYAGIVKRVVVANAKGGRRRTRPDGSDALAFTVGDDPKIIHIGALSGSALTEHTPKLVQMYYDRLSPSIGVVALGGIFNGQHAWECIKRGAVGFECTTAYFQYGEGIFNDIVEGLPSEYALAA